MSWNRAFGLTALVAAVFAYAPEAVAQTADVTGTAFNKRGDQVGTFTGVFELERFDVRNGQLVAIGTLSGTLDREDKKDRTVKNRRIALPVDMDASGIGESDPTAAAGELEAALQECDVLNLVLGPLDLNLLGLEVHLDTVILDIIADPAGGLLGQILSILCGLNLTGILDLIGDLGDLADFLNFLLTLF
jgi:hypothetical protein